MTSSPMLLRLTGPTLRCAGGLALCAALPFVAAFQEADEKLDLTPRFKKGQSITINQSFTVEGALDELSVSMDGQPVFGDGVAADINVEGDISMSETIDEVRGTDIAKMHVTFDAMDIAMTGEVDAMGEGEAIDESVDVPLTGHTIEMTVDEDGEITAKDVTEGMEPLDEGMLGGLTQKNHFEMILPTEPVEVGVEFELAPDWQDFLRDAMSNMDSAEMDAEQAEMAKAVMNAVIDATEMEAIGKVTGVADGIATIEYEMSVIMTIDDLMGLVMQIAPEGSMDEVPPGIEAMIEVAAEMSGTGQFDLALGQMTKIDIAGDFDVTMNGNADLGGQSAAMDMLFAGEFELGATLTVE